MLQYIIVENNKKSYDNGRIYCIRNSVSNDIYIYILALQLNR